MDDNVFLFITGGVNHVLKKLNVRRGAQSPVHYVVLRLRN